MTHSDLLSDLHKALPFCDDLRRAPWKGSDNPLAGQCYTASEVAFYVLGGKVAGWKPMFVRVNGAPHWYLQHTSGQILDPTEQQFDTPIHRELAIGKGFLTKELSKRGRILLRRMRAK